MLWMLRGDRRGDIEVGAAVVADVGCMVRRVDPMLDATRQQRGTSPSRRRIARRLRRKAARGAARPAPLRTPVYSATRPRIGIADLRGRASESAFANQKPVNEVAPVQQDPHRTASSLHRGTQMDCGVEVGVDAVLVGDRRRARSATRSRTAGSSSGRLARDPGRRTRPRSRRPPCRLRASRTRGRSPWARTSSCGSRQSSSRRTTSERWASPRGGRGSHPRERRGCSGPPWSRPWGAAGSACHAASRMSAREDVVDLHEAADQALFGELARAERPERRSPGRRHASRIRSGRRRRRGVSMNFTDNSSLGTWPET